MFLSQIVFYVQILLSLLVISCTISSLLVLSHHTLFLLYLFTSCIMACPFDKYINIYNKQWCLQSRPITKWRLKEKYVLWTECFVEMTSGSRFFNAQLILQKYGDPYENRARVIKHLGWPEFLPQQTVNNSVVPLSWICVVYELSCSVISCSPPNMLYL